MEQTGKCLDDAGGHICCWCWRGGGETANAEGFRRQGMEGEDLGGKLCEKHREYKAWDGNKKDKREKGIKWKAQKKKIIDKVKMCVCVGQTCNKSMIANKSNLKRKRYSGKKGRLVNEAQEMNG